MSSIFFQNNRFADAVPVASGTALGDPANLADLRSYTFWKPSALPATVTVDCGSAKAADSFVVFGHDLFSKGCTIELRGSTDNFVSSNVLVATKTPGNNNPFAMLFNSVSYRYWRINITGTSAPTLAMVVAGASLVMQSVAEENIDAIGRSLNSISSQNDNGQPLGKIVNYSSRIMPLSFFVSRSWLRSTFVPAWDAGLRGSPAIFSWDSANYPDELQYGICGDSFKSPHTSSDMLRLTFDFKGPA